VFGKEKENGMEEKINEKIGENDEIEGIKVDVQQIEETQ
jgi:hypothetical protein